MKFARLEAFIEEVRRDEELQRAAPNPRIFYLFNTQWFDEKQAKLDDATSNALQGSYTLLTIENHWRDRKSDTSYFWIRRRSF